MKVFIFGANGMLGGYLTKYLRSHFEIVPITRKEVDLNQEFSLILDRYTFESSDVIINAAGIIKQRDYSSSELIRVNSLFPHFLSTIGCNVIHITTDCVFSGKEGSYNENSLHDCLDDYGKSKSLGECAKLTVIRTSIIGEELYNKKSLIEWVKTNQNTTINGYLNHFWNGVTCLELSKQIKTIIETNSYWKGVRHYHSPDTVSKYDLVSCINEIYELNNTVNPVMSNYCDRSLSTNYNNPVLLSIKNQIAETKEFDLTSTDRPKVIDSFLFFREFDMLKLRLEYLNDIVDYFVICESNYTHSGKLKPYYLDEIIDDIPERIRNKIIRLKYEPDIAQFNFPDGVNQFDYEDDYWKLERQHREFICKNLSKFSDNDFFMLSDVDEIPNKQTVERLILESQTKENFCLSSRFNLFFYNFNTLGKTDWAGTVFTTVKTAIQTGCDYLRTNRFSLPFVSNSGWHFSYFGDPEDIIKKLESFAHQEYNKENFKDLSSIFNSIKNKKYILDENLILLDYSFNDFPEDLKKCIINNFDRIYYCPTQEKFKDFPSLNFISIEESESRRQKFYDNAQKYDILNVRPNIFKRYTDNSIPIKYSTKDWFVSPQEFFGGSYLGCVGALVSHLKAIKNWYENTDEEYAFFCEDDMSFETVEYWNFTWEEFFNKLPKDWDCIQLSISRVEPTMFDHFKTEVHLRQRIFSDFSCCAYLIRRNHAKNLLDHYYDGETLIYDYLGSDYESRLSSSPTREVVYPFIENIIYTIFDNTKIYTFPLFVEDPNNVSTLDGLYKEPHNTYPYRSITSWWKEKGINMPLDNLFLGDL